MQTAFRFDTQLIGRLKEAARQADISLNEYVTIILSDATKDIESVEEQEEGRRKTREFLDTVCGSWSGTESAEEIMRGIREGRKEREITPL